MDGRPTGFWGKLRKDDDQRVVAWHPLAAHCADVAACAFALIERTLLRRRLAALAGLDDLDPAQRARLVVLAALHDIGKFNHGFQNKAFNREPKAGHVAEVATLLLDRRQHRDLFLPLADALELRALAGWDEDGGSAVLGLLLASIGHHGRPAGTTRVVPGYWRPAHGLDPLAGIGDLVERTKGWLPEAWADGRPLPLRPELQHAFAGLVMLADWLGSDTNFFPYTEPGEGDRFTRSVEVARRVLDEGRIDPALARAALGTDAIRFENVWPHLGPPREIQRRAMALPQPASASVTVLESETGSGKTEAVLARFLQLYQSGEVDGLYFALPTRTAATQLHGRVLDAVTHAFGEDAPPVVMAVPGYLIADDQQATRLAPFEVLWNDDPKQRYRYRGWAAERPKRFLAAPVAVGTIDQVLLSALRVSHAHLRSTALSRQLLVVDEVHASDAYMNAVLREVLKTHARAGGHAVLLSATLGSTARQQLLQAAGAKLDPLDRRTASEAPYPSLLHWERGSSPVWTRVEEAGRPKDVHVELAPWMEEPSTIAARALDAAEAGAKILIIRNTVRGAVEMQRAMEQAAEQRGSTALLFRCGELPAPHHARFAKADREKLDKSIERRFGKERHSGGCVAVATQTVQQSLDLDADWMITDLCPIDVLLQRVGRLHRHTRADRPAAFAQAHVVVLTPSEPDLSGLLDAAGAARGGHGIGTVYEDLRVLQATWDLLAERPRLTVPADNRALVEGATHSDALAPFAQRDERWARHAQTVDGAAIAKRILGRNNAIDRTVSFLEVDVAFPSKELEGDIKTRLGEDDRRIELGTLVCTPFGSSIRELTIPGWQARDIPSDPAVTIEPINGSLRLDIGGAPFVYDRLGLRPLDRSDPLIEDLSDA